MIVNQAIDACIFYFLRKQIELRYFPSERRISLYRKFMFLESNNVNEHYPVVWENSGKYICLLIINVKLKL